MTETATQYKLAEAEFFLRHLKQNRGKFNKFNFYLSAFVGAALSVLDTMKSEYTRRPKEFDEWLEKGEEGRTEEEVQLVDLMYHMRQITVHEGRLNARAMYKIEFSEKDRQQLATAPPVGKLMISMNGTRQSCRLIVENRETGDLTTFQSVKVPLIRRYVLECPDEDVYDICQRFFKFLVTLVVECTSKFGNRPAISRRTRSRSWKTSSKKKL